MFVNVYVSKINSKRKLKLKLKKIGKFLENSRPLNWNYITQIKILLSILLDFELVIQKNICYWPKPSLYRYIKQVGQKRLNIKKTAFWLFSENLLQFNQFLTKVTNILLACWLTILIYLNNWKYTNWSTTGKNFFNQDKIFSERLKIERQRGISKVGDIPITKFKALYVDDSRGWY